MTQTLALLHDAYREMNAKRMFWIVLVISGLVVIGFATIGVSANNQITLLGMSTRLPALFKKGEMFKLVFEALGIQLWLSSIAMILAIISTASIFPDLMGGGSIDLYLCKPISRLRLFLTKYAAGMIFVALQVFIFSAASFLVIGLRGDTWEPRLFLAVPLVVCVFSYLWCVSVLLGVITRSTLAAALLTIVAWLAFVGVDRADFLLLMAKTHARHVVDGRVPQLKAAESQAKAERRTLAATQPSEEELAHANRLDRRWHDLETEQVQDTKTLGTLTSLHKLTYNVKTLLPKTRETNDLLGRYLLTSDDLHEVDNSRRGRRRADAEAPTWMGVDAFAETADAMRARPISWIIGTSLIFEAFILAWAARIFCRRDF